jgi:phosphoribosylanthranilate isomerase
MFVKICGITNEDDALLAVAMGADAVGFVFAPSPRQIAVQQAFDITRRLPPEILTVGVFRDAGSPRLPEARSLVTDLILLDAVSPGSGQVFDWTLAGEVPEGVRLILAGGLDPENVTDAVKAVEPWGVDVSSGVERSPGRKDAIKVKRFIERARAAAPEPYLGPDDLPYDWSDE